MTSTHEIRVVPFGERALLVELGSTIDVAVNARVHALASRLDRGELELPGLGPTVPAYASLLVPFDPAQVDAEALAAAVSELAGDAATEPPPEGALVEVPVTYGGNRGLDLDSVAEHAGLTPDEVVSLHTEPTYRVFMLGFAPGFAYLGPLPEALRLPRHAEPRTHVPAGSVAIAGAQAAIYPQATAGGWHLLGRTDLRLWDPDAARPALLSPGDRVRFVPR